MTRASVADPCPCGSGRAYDKCCGDFIDGTGVAVRAEQLMRSRYTAFVLSREHYLLSSWHPSTRPATLGLNGTGAVKWLGLKILGLEAGGEDDAEGRVEFVARYRRGGGPAARLHENSRFVREGGHWFYVDGEIDGGKR